MLEADAAELQYGSPIDGDLGYGNIGLRRLLAQRTLRSTGAPSNHAGVMLTSGGVQGIAEAVAAFLDPHDHAVVEAPTWDYTLRAIQATGAQATAIPIDDDGMQIDLLEQRIARLEAAGERLKLVYIIATFNVPTAVSLSEERRRRLVTLAQEHSFVIVEDNVYADLRYDGERLPSLYSLDDAGLVVKVDSFSKTLMPALRLGWVTGDPAVVDTRWPTSAATSASARHSSRVRSPASWATVATSPTSRRCASCTAPSGTGSRPRSSSTAQAR